MLSANGINENTKRLEPMFLSFVTIGTIITIIFLGSHMRFLVDLATILSFMTAPFLAILNYKLIYNVDFPEKYRPSPYIKSLAIFGITF